MTETQAQSALQAAFAELGLAENHQAWSKLVQYWQLLQKWNQAINLTAIRDPHEMLIKHLFDSLSVAPVMTWNRLLDVGTGAGFPGLVLAILAPEKSVALIDSNSKKTRFLMQAVHALQLTNVEVVHERVEAHRPAVPYDAIVSRAFASLSDFLTLTRHLLSEDGYWWAMKAQQAEAELAQLPAFARLIRCHPLQVPQLSAQRRVIQLAPIHSNEKEQA
ncbi:16S rRNA (guanine(527)-N(7))-methyltransferase RsmG [Thiomicrospira sp. WB1]|uniref:16S rRNA (guanine(527)-N(7))-methyltransferase RsmG n=1 Tax=Thiomicrospira sp. WB1 TaxID=1685380 RepID=UPI00074A49F4|nr:16S rRNA (guanine(527)-N(7))-methyltransferase RsmG [Thiomicrospira sp. WB1]KUJ72381.1 16S rRNA (guanine(527)-N(7))-methyltransferase RsmG [Thiomicrospira sp. WB1]